MRVRRLTDTALKSKKNDPDPSSVATRRSAELVAVREILTRNSPERLSPGRPAFCESNPRSGVRRVRDRHERMRNRRDIVRTGLSGTTRTETVETNRRRNNDLPGRRVRGGPGDQSERPSSKWRVPVGRRCRRGSRRFISRYRPRQFRLSRQLFPKAACRPCVCAIVSVICVEILSVTNRFSSVSRACGVADFFTVRSVFSRQIFSRRFAPVNARRPDDARLAAADSPDEQRLNSSAPLSSFFIARGNGRAVNT